MTMNKITVEYLCSLGVRDTLDTISRSATFLSKVSVSNNHCTLYSINGFYVEITTYAHCSASSMKFFEDGEELDKYLNHIDVAQYLS
jgi:hypothetical protein